MNKSSLNSSNIRGGFFQQVSRDGHLCNGVHALMGRPTLPVPIFVGFHFVVTAIDANRVVHAPAFSIRRQSGGRLDGMVLCPNSKLDLPSIASGILRILQGAQVLS